MTYKTSSDNLHKLKREGSHSTKGSARGYATVLPPDAKDVEEELVTFAERVTGILEALDRAQFLLSIVTKYSAEYSERLGVVRDLEGQIGEARHALAVAKDKHRGAL